MFALLGCVLELFSNFLSAVLHSTGLLHKNLMGRRVITQIARARVVESEVKSSGGRVLSDMNNRYDRRQL